MSLLFERMPQGLHGSFGSRKATHRAGFVSQNFVKLMCSYCAARKNNGTFSETFSPADPMLVPCGSAALVAILETALFWNKQSLGTGEAHARFLQSSPV